MSWEIKVPKLVLKNVAEMPPKVQLKFQLLTEILAESGPTGPYQWRNYGKLQDGFHCHLSNNHQWVACWRQQGKALVLEIHYAGSHQGAPY